MNPNLGSMVADLWIETLKESPDPLRSSVLHDWLTGTTRTYRERLDEQPRNGFGDLIPRIVTVRRNLRSLGRPRQRPNLP